jgi:hypothetical protein
MTNIVLVARVKQFIEWFNELDDVAMEKLLAHLDEYIEKTEKGG